MKNEEVKVRGLKVLIGCALSYDGSDADIGRVLELFENIMLCQYCPLAKDSRYCQGADDETCTEAVRKWIYGARE